MIKESATCHREEELLLRDGQQVSSSGLVSGIREVVMTKRMLASDNKVSHKMKNEMNLTDAEMQTLVRWVNAGAPVDGDVDPLVGLQWPETKG